jgi:hypothetical protein
VNVGDYGKNVPAVRGDTLTDLPSPYAVERPEAKSTGSGRQGNDPKDNRIAQNLDGISYQEDPFTGLIKVIIGGIVVGIGVSLEAAKDIAQHIMRSQRGRQGRKKDSGLEQEIRRLREQGGLTEEQALEELRRRAKSDPELKRKLNTHEKSLNERRNRASGNKKKPKQKKNENDK